MSDSIYRNTYNWNYSYFAKCFFYFHLSKMSNPTLRCGSIIHSSLFNDWPDVDIKYLFCIIRLSIKNPYSCR